MSQFLKFILDPENALSSSHLLLVPDALRFYFLTTRAGRWDCWGRVQVRAVVWSRGTSGSAEAESFVHTRPVTSEAL